MKTLKHGKLYWEKNVSCQRCESEMQVNHKDLNIHRENYLLVLCDDCGEEIKVDSSDMPVMLLELFSQQFSSFQKNPLELPSMPPK